MNTIKRNIDKYLVSLCRTLAVYNLLYFLIKLLESVVSLGLDSMVYGMEVTGRVLLNFFLSFGELFLSLYAAIGLWVLADIIIWIKRQNS